MLLESDLQLRQLALPMFPDGQDWMDVGPELDMGQLSDDYEGKLGFAGTLIGMCAQDLDGARRIADFDYFRYIGIE